LDEAIMSCAKFRKGWLIEAEESGLNELYDNYEAFL